MDRHGPISPFQRPPVHRAARGNGLGSLGGTGGGVAVDLGFRSDPITNPVCPLESRLCLVVNTLLTIDLLHYLVVVGGNLDYFMPLRIK